MLLPLPDNSCALCGRRGPPVDSGMKPELGGCTGRCVKGGLSPRDYAIESSLLLELRQWPAGTALSLEQALAGSVGFASLSERERARFAARRLVARGQLLMLQHGRPVSDSEDDDAPIEVRLP